MSRNTPAMEREFLAVEDVALGILLGSVEDHDSKEHYLNL